MRSSHSHGQENHSPAANKAREGTATISKREYSEQQIPRERMAEYQRAFNRLRPESARLDLEPDGSQVLLVRGWLDADAAALLFLLREGTALSEITWEMVDACGTSLDLSSAPADLLGSEPEPGIDPFGPEPQEAPLMDVSDLPEPSTMPVEAPPAALPPLTLEPPLRALLLALGALGGISEEEALRQVITNAARRLGLA